MGRTRVKVRAGTPAWVRLFRQFTAPLVLVLILAATVTGFLKESVDAVVILVVVVVNAFVGFFQESKAENALEALMKWSWGGTGAAGRAQGPGSEHRACAWGYRAPGRGRSGACGHTLA